MFLKTSVEYLGRVISDKGVEPDLSKIESMLNWPSPSLVKQLHGFLGLIGFYHRCIKTYAYISFALTELLERDALKWDSKAQQAFDDLKKAMRHAPVLSLLDFTQKFIIQTDRLGLDINELINGV